MLFVPLAVILVGGSIPAPASNGSTTVHAYTESPIIAALRVWIPMWSRLIPLALIAGWRTFVYARGRSAGRDRSWRGVLQAGACGVLYLLLSMPALTIRLFEAPGYILFYSVIAFAVGATAGLVLWATALAVLAVTPRTT